MDTKVTYSRDHRPRWWAPAAIALLAGVAALGWWARPSTPWEHGEVAMALGVAGYQPSIGLPQAPGAPLTVLLARGAALVTGDAFQGAVALSLLSWLVAVALFLEVFRRLLAAGLGGFASDRAAICALAAGALLALSPAWLATATMALPVAAAMPWLALALLIVARGVPSVSAWGMAGFGSALAVAAGCHPLLAPAVLAALLYGLWRVGDNQRQLAGVVGAAVVTAAWLIPLVDAVGGLGQVTSWLTSRAGEVFGYEGPLSRDGWGPFTVVARFLTHPWGPKWLAGPVVVLAIVGAVRLVGRSRQLVTPLALFAGCHFAIAVLLFNPAGAVQAVAPTLPLVALLTVVGLESLARLTGQRWLPLGMTGLLVVPSLGYSWPVLALRGATEAPVVAAARYAGEAATQSGLVAVTTLLAPFAAYALPDRPLPGADAAAAQAFDQPEVSVLALVPGEVAGATVFRRGSSDSLGKLTGDRLPAVSVRIIPAAERFAPIRGVWGLEQDGAGQWRWLEPLAELRVPGNRNTRLTLALPHTVPWPECDVAVQVAGAPAASLSLRRGEQGTLDLQAPGDQPYIIRVHSTRSFVPAEEGLGKDARRLAVQLLSLETYAPGASQGGGGTDDG